MNGLGKMTSAALLLACAACQRGTAPTDTASVAPAANVPAPAAPAAKASAAAPQADLATCETYPASDSEERQRTKPLPIPARFAAIMRSDMDHLAVTTLAGGTLCIDARWTDNTSAMTLSADGRFVSFDWGGYEAFGHMLVDRAGRGKSIDTGAAPIFSPSRKLLAAVEQSASGFGALNAFAVWQVGAQSLTEVAMIDQLPRMEDWRIDKWSGDGCIELSAVTFENVPDDNAALKDAPREHFTARAGKGWTLAPADGPGACAAPGKAK
jgi:hypothetical protein